MLDRADDSAGSPPTEETELRPVAFRGAGFAPQTGRYASWIALVLALGVWQLAGSTGLVNSLFLPTPVATISAIYQLALSGALWQHLSWSIMRIGSGWVLGTLAGVIVGFAIGLSSLARSVGITFISALFPIPKNRIAAVADSVARDRRGAEDRDHRARRVLLDRDLGL